MAKYNESADIIQLINQSGKQFDFVRLETTGDIDYSPTKYAWFFVVYLKEGFTNQELINFESGLEGESKLEVLVPSLSGESIFSPVSGVISNPENRSKTIKITSLHLK